MFEGKPIIGLSGGIGSGKTLVAKLFADEGCMVISSDELVTQAYKDHKVKQTLRHWWGSLVFDPDGEVDRPAVARKIFDKPDERRRLEQLLHPIVAQRREKLMHGAANDPRIKAFVWDTPLLFENGLNRYCDKVVFVDAPHDLRTSRVRTSRAWEPDELTKRENLQMPLDKKREISDYVVSNAADAEFARNQVRQTLVRILADTLQTPSSD
ncbi:MAG: dephospho-CoA kinase [Tepidisphaeraceae bacterium]